MAEMHRQRDADWPTSGLFQDGVVVSAAVAIAMFASVWGLLVPPTARSHVLVVSWAALLVTSIAAISAVVVARTPRLLRRQQVAWRLLAWTWVGMAAYQLGDVAVMAALTPHLPLSWMAALPAALTPVLFWALVRLAHPARNARENLGAMLDAGMVVAAGWLAMWQFVVAPAIARGVAGEGLGPLATVGLVGDLFVLGGAAFMLLRCPRGPRRLPLLLLAASSIVLVVGDVLRASVLWGGPLHAAADLLSLSPPVLITLAAVLERRRLRAGRPEDEGLLARPVTALPHIALVVAYGVLVTAAAVPSPQGLLALLAFAGALPILLIVRQAVAARESERLHRERALITSDARFKSLVQHSSDVVVVVDAGWIVTFATPSAQRVLGHRPGVLVGSSILDVMHSDDLADAANRLRELVSEPHRSITGHWRMRRADGTEIDTDTVCVNLIADEHVRGLVLTIRDASEDRSLEAQLVHQAFHDPLTGLANRALFIDRVQHALARRRGGNLDTLGVVFIDLDFFKTINDTLGHSGGDALLRAVATRIVRGLRAFDTAARLGGDEFAVLVDDVHRQEHVTQVADRLANAFTDAFVIDGREIRASASIGVALATVGQTAEDLLRNADLAMYLAKSRGRGQSAVFEPSMHAAAMTRLELQRDLRVALERGELSLVYQPIHALESQSIVGAEALLRWVHPSRGPIPPSTFVPLAEETGLILPIGQWVMNEACRNAQAWRTGPNARPLRVSINVSGRQIPDRALFEQVERALDESGLTPDAIIVELTERVLLQHTEHTLDLLHRLKAIGVRIAIDDFGTGVSSLSYLQRLPIDVLKIDRTFVDAILTDAHATQLTRAIVSLGESMSLLTIAEGIENAEQAERLRGLGCDYGQGYLFGVPMSADALAAHASKSRTMASA